MFCCTTAFLQCSKPSGCVKFACTSVRICTSWSTSYTCFLIVNCVDCYLTAYLWSHMFVTCRVDIPLTVVFVYRLYVSPVWNENVAVFYRQCLGCQQRATVPSIVREYVFCVFFSKSKKRDILRFFEVSCQKNVKKRRKPYPSFMYTNQITGIRQLQIGYFPKYRLLGAL